METPTSVGDKITQTLSRFYVDLKNEQHLRIIVEHFGIKKGWLKNTISNKKNNFIEITVNNRFVPIGKTVHCSLPNDFSRLEHFSSKIHDQNIIFPETALEIKKEVLLSRQFKINIVSFDFGHQQKESKTNESSEPEKLTKKESKRKKREKGREATKARELVSQN